MNILRQFSAALLILTSLAFAGSAHAARESFAQVNAAAHPGYGGVVSFSLVSGSAQVFAYSIFGGIARSDDGAIWAPKNSGLTGLGIRGVGVNSLLTSNVYAVGIDAHVPTLPGPPSVVW